MQYQIYTENTGKLIATIDTETGNCSAEHGYIIRTEDEKKTVVNVLVAEFEKVSFKEYAKSFIKPGVILDITRKSEAYDALELPVRSTEGSAGYDFITPIDLTIPAGETVKIRTGIKVKMAEGFVLMLYPRSGLGFKYQLTMDNTVCVVDSDYYNNESNEGHIFVKMTNHSDKDCFISKGHAYCQGVFHKYFVTDTDYIVKKAKRVGGYGSTDNNRK